MTQALELRTKRIPSASVATRTRKQEPAYPTTRPPVLTSASELFAIEPLTDGCRAWLSGNLTLVYLPVNYLVYLKIALTSNNFSQGLDYNVRFSDKN
jgi:hypothetical protein